MVTVCDHLFFLGGREPEDKIAWETSDIPFYRLIQGFGGYAIKDGKINVKQYFVSPNKKDGALEPLARNQRRFDAFLTHVFADTLAPGFLAFPFCAYRVPHTRSGVDSISTYNSGGAATTSFGSSAGSHATRRTRAPIPQNSSYGIVSAQRDRTYALIGETGSSSMIVT